jgi:hypothetical protein
MMPGCRLLTQHLLPLPQFSKPAKIESMKDSGTNPAVLFWKGLAYPWLWAGKKVGLVEQETIEDFYSPRWRPCPKPIKDADSE